MLNHCEGLTRRVAFSGCGENLAKLLENDGIVAFFLEAILNVCIKTTWR